MPLNYYTQRYPRLIRALRWTGTLCASEAAAALRAHKEYKGSSWAAGEAVTHYCQGGPVAPLIQRARRNWQTILSL